MDVTTKAIRSKIMASVRQKNTGPEQTVARFLRSHGLKFRRNVKSLPGSPDFVLKAHGTAIFVHGCFWHGHKNCRAGRLPSSNLEYWAGKIKANVNRDRKKTRQLRRLGWKVITVWQCSLKNEKRWQVKIEKYCD